MLERAVPEGRYWAASGGNHGSLGAVTKGLLEANENGKVTSNLKMSKLSQ